MESAKKLEPETPERVLLKDDDRHSLGEVERPISDTDLLRIMECPVCNEFPVPPIFSCEKGHFTCNSCIKLLANCSLCESAFTGVRNFALEEIIESSKFRCRNSYLGCPEVVTGAELNHHVEECIYRPLECKEQECLRPGLSPNEYYEHMVEHHGISGCKKRLLCGKVGLVLKQSEDSGDYPPFYLRVLDANKGPTILFMTRRYRTFMCWWPVCIEPGFFGDYYVTFSLESQNDRENLAVRWTLPLQPSWKSFDEVRDTGRCAVIPDTHLLPYYTDDKSWDLRVEVVKKMRVTGKRPWLEYLKHYYPLLLLVLVGICAVILSVMVEYGLTWFDSLNEVGQGLNNSDQEPAINTKVNDDFMDESYIGYRGFYYKSK